MISVIILLGAPGAGKGTQAARISADLSLPHIATGDLFRANLKEGTEFGVKAKGYMEAGQLVPDEVVLDMLFDRVVEDDCREGYLLDGFPRTLAQAEALDQRLRNDARLQVVNLEVDDETIITRVAGRLLCRQCSHLHQREFSPPKKEGVCDLCGGELYQRADDTPEVVRKRLAVYHEQTEPLVRFYSEKDVLQTINGERSPDAVAAALASAVGGGN